jgi:hypothetical protein
MRGDDGVVCVEGGELRNVKEGKGLDVNNVTQAQEGESFNHSLATFVTPGVAPRPL